MKTVRYRVDTRRGPYDGEWGQDIISRSFWSTEGEAEDEAEHRRTENNKLGRTYTVVREEFDERHSDNSGEQHG
jgi:hypothetical protein